MIERKTRQTILEHLETLPGEQVKILLLTWLMNSSGELKEFEQLLTNQSAQITEESLDCGEIDSALNFQPLTEDEMVQQSKLALEAYRRKGFGVAHNRVLEWADSLD